MKKIFLILIMGYSVASAQIMFNAKDTRALTNQTTKKLYAEVLASENGKKAYEGLTQMFNDHIADISAKGHYDSFTITIYNNDSFGIKGLLKPLSSFHQDVLRKIIIEELKSKGYKIDYNQYWNNPETFAISVSW